MADNFTLDAGSGGSTLAVASLTFSGDTAGVQIVGCGIMSGSEGSWTLSQMVGGAGAVAAGVQRITLASDDPAVVLLTTIDSDTDAIKTAVEGTLTVGSHAVTNAGTFAVQVDAEIPAGTQTMGAVRVVDSAGHELDMTTLGAINVEGSHAGNADNSAFTTGVPAWSQIKYYDGSSWDRVRGDSTDGLLVNMGTNNDVTNGGTFVVQEDGAALTALQLIDDIVLAEDAVHSSGDKGVMSLFVRVDGPTEHAPAGDYVPGTMSEHGCLNVDPAHWATLDDCDATTGWTVIGNDTDNLTTATNHVWKTGSLSFDKVNGAANTVHAGIQKTLSSTSLNAYMEEGGGFLLGSMFLSSIADVDYVWFRVGTDASNYNEWRVQDDGLTAGEWNALRGVMRGPHASTGNGWDSSAITWMAVGVAFDGETDTLAAILVDGLFANSGLQTSADITSQISSTVSSPNVKVAGYLGSVPTGAGAVTSGTQRITLGSNDPAVAHLATVAGDTTSLDGKVTACNTGAVVIASGTVTTVSAVTAISNALPAGDNNIGNVDIVTLPSGNLGQQAMAASLSMVPASDITDATYIGDIKFGEALPAGTNNIGDVDVLTIAAGTNTVGGTISQASTSTAYDGTTAVTIERASGVAASGTTAIVSATLDKKVRILALFLKATSATATNVYLATTTDTDVIGNAGNPIPLAVDADGDNDSGFVMQFNPGGWTETSTANEALNLILSAAQDVIWAITYIKVD